MDNNFLDSIKITEKDKKEAMINILHIVMNSSDILSLNEVMQIQPTLQSKLSEDEILAMYAISVERKISKMASRHNEKLSEYLNEEKLLEFINETVRDIQETRERTPNVKWKLSVDKIFNRLQRRKDYSSEEVKINEERKPKNKNSNIIDIRGYV